jgi:hypothetical protein
MAMVHMPTAAAFALQCTSDDRQFAKGAGSSICSWQLATGNWQLATGNWQLAAALRNLPPQTPIPNCMLRLAPAQLQSSFECAYHLLCDASQRSSGVAAGNTSSVPTEATHARVSLARLFLVDLFYVFIPIFETRHDFHPIRLLLDINDIFERHPEVMTDFIMLFVELDTGVTASGEHENPVLLLIPFILTFHEPSLQNSFSWVTQAHGILSAPQQHILLFSLIPPDISHGKLGAKGLEARC